MFTMHAVCVSLYMIMFPKIYKTVITLVINYYMNSERD